MKIVITGAFGYIGSGLFPKISGIFQGHEIVLIDNLSACNSSEASVFSDLENCSFINGDIRDLNLVEIFCGAEIVIHLAALSGPARSFENPRETEEINFRGTVRVAEACIKTNSALIFPSTTSVYGKKGGWIIENGAVEDINPQSPYAESKLKAELYLRNEARAKGLMFSIFRFGTVFGMSNGMRFDTAINKFCMQAATGEFLTVWTTAMDQVRPYLDLNDAVGAISYVAGQRLFDGEIYNVVTLNSSVRDIFSIIREMQPGLRMELMSSRAMNAFSYQVSGARLTAKGFVYSGDLRSQIAIIMESLKSGKKYVTDQV